MTLAQEIRAAYDRVGETWDDGPARVYRALAQPVVEAAGDVAGLLALDVGTGSGVLADALVRRGARVVGLDLSHGMLVRGAADRPPGVVADVRALPLRSGTVDLVTASFVLNHLEEPVAGLRELARVARPGARLLATTFEGEAPHPAKALVEEVAARHGHVVPHWYAAVKAGTLPLLSTPELFASAAQAAGLDAAVERVEVELALTPAEVVGWRLGMAQLAPFVAGLAPDARAALVADAHAAVAAVTEPVRMAVLLLATTVHV
jgi:ubiquinone/menaquinone biosynthesis C-methylase UbiE